MFSASNKINKYKVLLFYKYVNIADPESLVKEHLDWCIKNEIKGRVFFSKEGVNGTVSGTIEQMEDYKSNLTGYKIFEDIWFKEDDAYENAFKKMHVRLKNEIVRGNLQDTIYSPLIDP